MKKLNDQELIDHLKLAVREERRLAVQILEYLHEVDRRKLYADFGHPSLWDFCTKELGYSEGAASRRIGSMRLLREMPELTQDLTEGRQTLSTLAQAQRFFRAERKHLGTKVPLERKRMILSKLENQSSRECERTLLDLSSAPMAMLHSERTRAVGKAHTELRLVIHDELLAKLKRIQARRSNVDPTLSYVALLEYMADEILKRLDPEDPEGPLPPVPPTSAVAPMPKEGRTAIPIATRRYVWSRDQGRCTWREGKNLCGSTLFLEIDHIHPVALGGTHEPENLRLRCRAHNQRAAVKIFGSNAVQSKYP